MDKTPLTDQLIMELAHSEFPPGRKLAMMQIHAEKLETRLQSVQQIVASMEEQMQQLTRVLSNKTTT